jgi:hypothetical protein
MARNKPNPMLAKIEAQHEAKYRQKLEINSEFDMIALLLTVNEELHVGPGRAGRVLNAFLANKMEIAETIDQDYGPDKYTGDKEILHTKATLAKRMREILSPEDWAKWCVMFPLLRDYWEVEP